MGVTVHFEGRLKDGQAFLSLIHRVEEIAILETLLTEAIENEKVKLLRVQNEEDWDYEGPTQGIILYLHEDCDPVRLEFDRDLFVQEFVKTQFAGAQVHIKLISFLRSLAVFFEDLKIEDEGEYWETGDETVLSEHIQQCNDAIAELAKETPTAQVKVKDPNGRFIDMIR